MKTESNTKKIGTKSKLENLNDHMFTQMERLCDNELSGDRLKEEIDRSKAVSNLASQMINNASLVLRAAIAINDGLMKNPPRMLGLDGYDEEK